MVGYEGMEKPCSCSVYPHGVNTVVSFDFKAASTTSLKKESRIEVSRLFKMFSAHEIFVSFLLILVAED